MDDNKKQTTDLQRLFDELDHRTENMIKLLEKIESDSKEAFHCAFLALESDHEIVRFLENLLDYLRKIKPSNLSEDFVFKQIFKAEWDNKENDNMTKAHVATMEVSLARLNILFKQNSNEILKELLIDFVCDAKFWVGKVDSTQDFDWLILNTSRAISHSYYYMVRKSLYGVDENKFLQYDAQFVVATLQIRNAIESRIKQLLGIVEFKYKSKPVSFSEILTIVKKVKQLSSKEILFDRLETINNWANNHLHRGLRPYPWQMEWAEHEISKLFFIGETSDKKTFSIYASFETEDMSSLQNEFECESENHFSKKLKPGRFSELDIEITWRNKTEIHENQSK